MRLLKKLFTLIAWGFAAIFSCLAVSVMLMVFILLQRGLENEPATVTKPKSENAVGVVELTGEIISSEDFRKRLKKVVDDKSLKGIVIKIDTPGGAVGASEEIYRYIKEADAKKPVVCSLGNLAASGGVYAAVACRKIVTNRGTITGSIGVIFMTPNVSAITERAGFKMNVIKSGQFKDSGSPFRNMTGEDRNLIQNLVNRSYEQFLDIVSTSRGLPVEDVRKFADGRIILGEDAVELGLADEVGGIYRAGQLALEFAVPDTKADVELVWPKKSQGLMALFEDLSEARLVRWLFAKEEPQFLYRMY